MEQVLTGSLIEQSRRCGARLPLRGGRTAWPLCLLRAEDGRPGPAAVRAGGLVEVVRRCVQTGAEVEAVLAEISAINAELLARRELR